ncbi:MAG: hypothetical protein ACC628_21400 [Pirellulaceae bacterium]
MQHIRHFGFMAPQGRTERLNKIRRLLGVPDQAKATDESRDKFDGDSDAAADRNAARTCPACGAGRMIPGIETPRPTVMEILAMRLPGQPRQRL